MKGVVNNFKLDDNGKRKLRQLLAESFMLTAVYTASGGAVAGPRLSASHSYFKLHQDANRHEMEDHIALALTLDLPVPGGIVTLIGSLDEFGPATVDAEVSYGPALTPALFLDEKRQARPVEVYERIGLNALLEVVHARDNDAWRRIPAEHPVVFDQMKKIGDVGSAEFRNLFPALNNVQTAGIGADYLTIEWWADSMHKLGVRLSDMQAFLSDPKNKKVDLERNPTFAALRRKLADQMKHVASDNREEFGAPWGLVAMYLASGRKAPADVRIANAKLPGALYAGQNNAKALAAAEGSS
jgi:hypothetical protein